MSIPSAQILVLNTIWGEKKKGSEKMTVSMAIRLMIQCDDNSIDLCGILPQIYIHCLIMRKHQANTD